MTSSIALSLNSTVGHPGGEEPFPPPESALVMGSSAASSRSLPIFAPSRIAGSRPETAISPQVEAVKDAAMMLLRIDWTAYWGGERERETESGKREEERAREERGRKRKRERERERVSFVSSSSLLRKEKRPKIAPTVCVALSRGAAETASSQRDRATRAAAGTRKAVFRKRGGRKKMKAW